MSVTHSPNGVACACRGGFPRAVANCRRGSSAAVSAPSRPSDDDDAPEIVAHAQSSTAGLIRSSGHSTSEASVPFKATPSTGGTRARDKTVNEEDEAGRRIGSVVFLGKGEGAAKCPGVDCRFRNRRRIQARQGWRVASSETNISPLQARGCTSGRRSKNDDTGLHASIAEDCSDPHASLSRVRRYGFTAPRD
ncbi:hypothetical protein MRX96_014478 [Rhipicephalus microplus]